MKFDEWIDIQLNQTKKPQQSQCRKIKKSHQDELCQMMENLSLNTQEKRNSLLKLDIKNGNISDEVLESFLINFDYVNKKLGIKQKMEQLIKELFNDDELQVLKESIEDRMNMGMHILLNKIFEVD